MYCVCTCVHVYVLGVYTRVCMHLTVADAGLRVCCVCTCVHVYVLGAYERVCSHPTHACVHKCTHLVVADTRSCVCCVYMYFVCACACACMCKRKHGRPHSLTPMHTFTLASAHTPSPTVLQRAVHPHISVASGAGRGHTAHGRQGAAGGQLEQQVGLYEGLVTQ